MDDTDFGSVLIMRLTSDSMCAHPFRCALKGFCFGRELDFTTIALSRIGRGFKGKTLLARTAGNKKINKLKEERKKKAQRMEANRLKLNSF